MTAQLTLRPLFALTLALCSATIAEAQTQTSRQPQRAVRGLFGGNDANPKSRQTFDFSFGLNGTYDESVPVADPTLPTIQTPSLEGAFSRELRASLQYTRRTSGWLTFSLGGGSAQRAYQGGQAFSMLNHNAAGTATLAFKRLRIDTTQRVALGAYSLASSIGAAHDAMAGAGAIAATASAGTPLASADFAHAVLAQRVFATMSAIDVGYTIGRRSAVTAQFSTRRSEFQKASEPALRYERWGGRFTHQFGRHLGLRLGYYQQNGRQGSTTPASAQTHDLDIGADYSRPLSISRRTSLSFSTGSSIVTLQSGRQFQVIGDASLNHQLGRTWSARAGYRRGVQFIDGFAEPFFLDSILTSAGGSLANRIKVDFSGGYSRGQAGLKSAGRQMFTLNGSAQVQVSLTRYVGFLTQYLYDRHAFADTIDTPQGIAPRQDRHSAIAGLTVWLPLLR